MMAPNYLSVVERYFTPRYKTDLNKKPGEDVCILTHTNRISLITLAKSHPILRDGKEVINVDFQVDRNTNRLNNKVTGKSKRGAQNISITSPLCHVTCSDQSRFTIHAGMKGSLVEVNENLVSHPSLLTTKPNAEGYIAIILTHLQDHESIMNKLLTQEQYEQLLRQREITATETNTDVLATAASHSSARQSKADQQITNGASSDSTDLQTQKPSEDCNQDIASQNMDQS